MKLSSIKFLFLIITASLSVNEARAEDYTITRLYYSVRAESTDRLIDDFAAFVNQNGGYLSNMRSGYVEYKIPVRIQGGRQSIEKKIDSIPGVNIYSATRDTTDVTETIVDRKAKLKVASSNLEKLRALSGNAGLDDLLDLEKALARSLEEVESLKGDINYYQEQSSYFDIKIRMNQVSDTSSSKKVPIPWIRSLIIQNVMEVEQ